MFLIPAQHLAQLRFEFDVNQITFMYQFIALLEQAWMNFHGNADRDQVYGFDDLFRYPSWGGEVLYFLENGEVFAF
jgi:hypothetical protein